MKKCFIALTVIVSCFTSVYSMLNSLKRISQGRYNRISRRTNPVQKRLLWSHHDLGALTKTLPLQLPPKFSPIHGAAMLESNIVKNMLSLDRDNGDIFAQIVHKLFHQINPSDSISVTRNKAMAAYSLGPELLGHVVGALEKGSLEKDREKIITLWQREYRKKIEDKNLSSEKVNNLTSKVDKKINELLDLFVEGHRKNEKFLFSLFLSFLNLKAQPHNNHDMIHFLLGINEYVPVGFAIDTSLYQSLEYPSKSYTQDYYDRVKTDLISINNAYARINYAKENLPLAISTLIEEKRRLSLYPPKVVFGSYSYDNKPAVSNCAESALRDVWNNILYDKEKQEFNLSLLPNTLLISNKLKDFYQHYKKRDSINKYESGQAFMDLVSNIEPNKGISYVQENYELRSKDTEKNFITLFNHFFGTNSSDLKELSSQLSDERRSINFKVGLSNSDPSVKKIIMMINDYKKNEQRIVALCFSSEHSWTEYGDEERQKNMLDAEILSFEYDKDPAIRSLFYIHTNPSIARSLLYNQQKNVFDASMLYAMPIEHDYQKINIIKDILFYNKLDVLDYAYSLFKLLSNKSKLELIPEILDSRSFQDKLQKDIRFNQEFNTLLKNNLHYLFTQVIEDSNKQKQLLKKLKTDSEEELKNLLEKE